jgi:uncharacterized membrane protein YvbJ
MRNCEKCGRTVFNDGPCEECGFSPEGSSEVQKGLTKGEIRGFRFVGRFLLGVFGFFAAVIILLTVGSRDSMGAVAVVGLLMLVFVIYIIRKMQKSDRERGE